MNQPPATINIELGDNDVKEDLVSIINAMSKIRAEAVKDKNFSDGQKDEYLHLVYRLASGIKAVADEQMIKRMQIIADRLNKNKSLSNYDPMQDGYWRDRENKFLDTLDNLLFCVVRDDFCNLDAKHHVLQAVRYLGVEETSLNDREEVYNTILPFQEPSLIKESIFKKILGWIFGVQYKLIDQKEKVMDQEQITSQINENIVDEQDYWRVSGVRYRNGIYTVDLLKELLDAGNSRTQDRWAEYSEKAKKQGRFYVADMPLYFALFESLFKQKSKPESEKAREFIQKQIKKYWLTTLTRILYQPQGEDKIIHNYGTPASYPLEENIVGPDRTIESTDKDALEAILGTDNINKIRNVFKWINKTDTYLWRLNSKPKRIDERVTRFGAVDDAAYLYCGANPGGSSPTLGVRLTRKNKE